MTISLLQAPRPSWLPLVGRPGAVTVPGLRASVTAIPVWAPAAVPTPTAVRAPLAAA